MIKKVNKKESKIVKQLKNNNVNAIVWLHVIAIIYWLIITVVLSCYIIRNWNSMIDFTFFSKFNGNNLLFLIWIILILLPVVGKFEGFGIKFEALNKEVIVSELTKEKEKMTDEILKDNKEKEKIIMELKKERDDAKIDENISGGGRNV